MDLPVDHRLSVGQQHFWPEVLLGNSAKGRVTGRTRSVFDALFTNARDVPSLWPQNLEPSRHHSHRLRSVPANATTFLGLSAPLWQSLALTLQLAALTTAVLGLLGLPLAHWLNTTRWRLAAAVEACVALPIVLPPTVLGFYFLVAFSPQHPPGSWWSDVTGATLAFSFTGLVLASVVYSLPFAVQPFQAALRAVPREFLDAGTALGASPVRVFLRVHLPLAWRGVAAGLTLGFAHTLGEFGVVLMIGGSIPGVTKVASIALYDEVQALAYPQAHLFSGVLLGLSFSLLLIVTWLQRRRA